MFAAVRVYEGVDPSGAQEIARRGREGLIPLLRQASGFIAYHLVQAGDGTWVSISLFEDRAGAEASTQSAASWVRENLGHLVQAPPRVITGEVVATSADGG
jgi:quinol monooxygenase YgiN